MSNQEHAFAALQFRNSARDSSQALRNSTSNGDVLLDDTFLLDDTDTPREKVILWVTGSPGVFEPLVLDTGGSRASCPTKVG